MDFKLYSPVGIEATFFHESYLPEDEREERDVFADRYITANKKRWPTMYLDSWGCVEIPSPVFSTKKGLIDWFDKTCKELEKDGWYTCRQIELETEGGCHINHTMPVDKSNAILKNTDWFLNKYPSLVWSLLTYNDNHSSKINTGKLEENYHHRAVNLRPNRCRSRETYLYGDEISNRIELRFFQMPVTSDELLFHLEIASKLLLFSDKKSFFNPISNNEKSLKEFTLQEAIVNLKLASIMLNLKFKDFEKFGKIENMRDRFKLGNNYLV